MYICWGIMTPFYKGRKWLICFINILLLRHLITVCLLKYGKMLNVTNYKFDLYFILHTLYSKSNGRIKWWIMFVSSGLYQCLVGTEWINSDVLEIYWFLGCIFFVWFLTKFGNAFSMAEQTFIVLDRELIVENFIHGEPHVEGCNLVLVFNWSSLITPYSFISTLYCLGLKYDLWSAWNLW